MLAVEFLKTLRERGVHNVVAIDPGSKRVKGITRKFPRGERDVAAFIKANEDKNLYFSINEPLPTAPDTKLKKEHIARANFIHVDIDPDKSKPFEEERKRLEDGLIDLMVSETPPSFIIDSGGGFQPLWRVGEIGPEEAEGFNRDLINRFGGDPGTYDVSRIFRLPGTTNYPDAKKRKAGRQEAETKLVFEADTTYEPTAIAANVPPPPKIEAHDTSFDMDEALATDPLGPGLKNEIEKLEAANEHFKKRNGGDTDGMEDASTSALAYYLATEMKTAGFSDQETANALCANEHLYEEWDRRQLARIIARSGDRAEQAFDKLTDAQLERIERPKKPKKSKLNRIKAEDAYVNLSDDYLIEGMFDEATVNAMYGKPNAGKSFMALKLSHCIASGEPFGKRKTKPSNVLYFAAEAGQAFGKRIAAHKVKYGEDSFGGRFEYVPGHIDLFSDENHVADIVEAIREIQATTGERRGLAVFDTLARVTAGADENSGRDIGVVISNLDKIKEATGWTMLVIHHSGKDASKGMRGHSALLGAVDGSFSVAMKGDKEVEGSHGARVLTCHKARDDEYAETIDFRLEVVEIGKTREEGRIIRSCVVALSDEAVFEALEEQAVEKAEALLTDEERSVLRALEAALTEGGSRKEANFCTRRQIAYWHAKQCPERYPLIKEKTWEKKYHEAGESDGITKQQLQKLSRILQRLVGDEFVRQSGEKQGVRYYKNKPIP